MGMASALIVFFIMRLVAGAGTGGLSEKRGARRA
jgi:hypothetical protein